MVRATNIDQELDAVVKKNRATRRYGNQGRRGYRRNTSYFNPYNAYNRERAFRDNYRRGFSYNGHDDRGRSDYNNRSAYSNNNRSLSYNNNRNYQSGGFNSMGGIKLVTNLNKTKMYVSNLDFGVTQGDMRELFGSVGKLKHVALHYNRNGASQGTCEIVFERKDDAMKAYNQYNGVPLDGRAMSLEMMGEPTPYQGDRQNFRRRNNTNRQERKTEDKVEKTAEELDKELDAYLTKGAKERTSKD